MIPKIGLKRGKNAQKATKMAQNSPKMLKKQQ